MEFRIGVNLGDVTVDGEQIYGDSVNVDGAKTPCFFQRTAVQNGCEPSTGSGDGVHAVSIQEAIPPKSRSTLPP